MTQKQAAQKSSPTTDQAIRRTAEPQTQNMAPTTQGVYLGMGALQGLPAHPTTRPQRQAALLQLQRQQGNAFVQRRLGLAPRPAPQPAAAPVAAAATEQVQRAPNAPGGSLIKIPYAYNWEAKADIGRYVKITKVGFKIEGALVEMPPSGGQPQPAGGSGGTPPTINVGGQTDSKDPKKDTLAISVERKRQTDDWFSQKLSSLHKSIKPYEKESAGIKRSDKDVQGKVAYEGGVDISPFLFDSGKANFAAEFNVLSLKKEAGKKPEFTFLSVVPKASVGGAAKNFPVDGFQADLKGEVSVTFEPDYVALAQLALECPATWVFAAAAGGAAIIYFTYKDFDRRAKLFHGVRAQANAIAKAGASYGAAVTGESNAPSGRYEKDAFNKGRADLSKVLADNKIPEDEFMGLLKDQNLKADFTVRASKDYAHETLRRFEGKVRDEIKAWHDEHFIQSFFAMNYASDDIAVAESIIDSAEANGGMPTIG